MSALRLVRASKKVPLFAAPFLNLNLPPKSDISYDSSTVPSEIVKDHSIRIIHNLKPPLGIPPHIALYDAIKPWINQLYPFKLFRVYHMNRLHPFCSILSVLFQFWKLHILPNSCPKCLNFKNRFFIFIIPLNQSCESNISLCETNFFWLVGPEKRSNMG